MTQARRPDVEDREGRLDAVVAAYLRAAEAGEGPDPSEWLARHPDLAPELGRFLAGQSRLERVAAPLRAAVERGAVPPGQTLGDFKIIRELGRGGMAVVYEAEQLSLGRRVALKVLPFAATLDPRRLARFHNEARAAASLHHGNIVPVFAVGCERGVHYYAMQLIDGRSLAALLRQMRGEPDPAGEAGEDASDGCATTAYTPAAGSRATVARAGLTTEGPARGPAYHRRVAELGAQAAEALDYAHQLGVVHRDVKPANLLVDGRGAIWVADFGLAQFAAGEGGLTQTGDLLGTLRYMSPEQALAKRVPVDHRTDVYSLGATLYELLTLRPVFGGSDRQELLRQIAFEEPRPPRRLDKGIPAELETIVLKALEKDPADRYATAQELADDLRRFLKDEPIRARRPSPWQRLRKWARRQRALVASVGAVLLVALLLGAGSLWRESRRQAAREAAAGADVQEAEVWQRQERWPEALQALERAQGRLEGSGPAYLRNRIERLRQEVSLVARLEDASLLAEAITDGKYDFAGADAAFTAAWADLGVDVTRLAPQEAAELVRASAIRRRLVFALDHWASVKDRLRANSGESLRAVARLADDDPWRQRLREPRVRQDRSALTRLAGEPGVEDRPPEDLVWLGKALVHTKARTPGLRLLRRVQERHPEHFWANYWLANYLSEEPATLGEALGFYRAALALRPNSPNVWANLACALLTQRDLPEAERACRRAIGLKEDYAEAYNNLGLALLGRRKLQEAEEALRRAVTFKPGLANAHHNLGVVLSEQGKTAGVETAYRKALALDPDRPEFHRSLGQFLREQRRPAEAEAALRKALARAGRDSQGSVSHLVVPSEGRPDPGQFWADVHNMLGAALHDQGKWAEAEKAFRKAIALNPAEAMFHVNLGSALGDQGRLKEALAAYRRGLTLDPKQLGARLARGAIFERQGSPREAVAEYREAVRLKADSAVSHFKLGNALLASRDVEGAVASFRKAIRLDEGLPDAHWNLGVVLARKGQFREAAREMRRGHELGSRTPGWNPRIAQQLHETEQMARLDERLTAVLEGKDRPKDAAERLGFARLCVQFRRRPAAAARFYGEAFAAQPALADDLDAQHRYDAACAAALAGCGQGKDAAKLDAKERARLRRQALDWLRADLEAYRRLLEKSAGKAGPAVAQRLRHWLADADFAGLRGEAALAKLPDAERPAWQKLWADVADTRAGAEGKTSPAKKSDGK